MKDISRFKYTTPVVYVFRLENAPYIQVIAVVRRVAPKSVRRDEN